MSQHRSARVGRMNRAMASALVLAALGFADGAWAHGVWAAKRAGEWVVVLGEGAEDDAYAPSAVKQVTAQARDGTPAAVVLLARAKQVAFEPPPGTATLGIVFEDGYWSQRPDGKWVEGSRRQVPDARKAGYYQMFNRTVLAPTAGRPRPLGLPLEIVPLSDPLALKKGQTLRVQVLFEGTPLPGARLVPDYLNEGAGRVIADARGEASVPLRSDGLNVLKVSHNVPRSDRQEVDEDGYAATLSFALRRQAD